MYIWTNSGAPPLHSIRDYALVSFRGSRRTRHRTVHMRGDVLVALHCRDFMSLESSKYKFTNCKLHTA
jgi:hypothetical protein